VRVTEKEIVILKQIHFEFNKARIMPDSSELLAQIAQVLKEHPEIQRVSIEGHTDAVGTPQFNLRLSQQRAEAVRTWLMDSGIEGDRLQATGYGKTRPVGDNKTEEGRERNRRVEFHILPAGGTP
jgi:outer membrane protein OmpA-like peptidoglycan-associated protein